MVELLWRHETEGRVLDSPERKAALDKSLRDSLRLIKDDSVRSRIVSLIEDVSGMTVTRAT